MGRSIKITKDHDGMYHARAYVGIDKDGKRVYKRYSGYSKFEVEKMVAEEKECVTREKIERKHVVTVGECVDRYIAARSNILSPATVLNYKEYRKNHLVELMSLKLSDLTEDIVQQAINIEAGKFSSKTVRNAWGLVQSSLRTYKKNLRFSPLMPIREHQEMHIPTTNQLNALFEATYGKPMEIPILLAATCGMRRSEIGALDLKKDIDYRHNKIAINKAIVMGDDGQYHVKSPKTYSSTRVIDCPEWVIKRIAELKDTKMIRPNAMSNSYARLREKLGIEARFHDLRHYFASAMLALGVPDKYAMKRMGHSTPDMLKNVYQHIMADKDEEFSKTISDFFTINFYKNSHQDSHQDKDTSENK